ncbi:DMT family transporter [Cohnella cholangitidis]|uniref:DMT family transporter n=1 Tax=Cohnella cholangitidis TaxID=2598458 RepID=A0A7G5BSC7_9BACL|nr:DMT family transporter [Cohnella cholangitidis]QMV39861.1 DMT family transporter [Cohnella cholangitidis]
MTKQRSIYLLALLYAIIIGFSFLFTKIALQFADPIDTLAYRFTLSFLVMGVAAWAGWIKIDWQGRKWWRLLPIGLLYPTLFFGFQVYGLDLMSSSEAGIFQATGPIFTLFLASLLLKERATWTQKLSVMCSVGGVIYIMAQSGASVHDTSIVGVVLLLVSTVSLSLYGVYVRRFKEGYTSIQMSFVMMLVGCLVFNALAIGKHSYEGTMNRLWEPLTELDFILPLLYIGIMSSLVSSLLSNYLLSKMEAFKMSMFVNLGTFVSIAAGVLFLHERLEGYHIVGALLIVGGVLGVTSRKRKRIGNRALEVKAG